MPMQRVIDYLTRPEELLPTWQALLLGFLKVILLVAVTGSIHTIVNEEIMASVYKTKAQVKLIQQANATFPTADGLRQKQLLTYELSASDTVTGVVVDISFDEGTEIQEYAVTYSDDTPGGFAQQLLEKNRLSVTLQHDLTKNRTARIALSTSTRVVNRKEAGEPEKMPDVHVMGKDKRGDVPFAFTE